MSERNGTDFDRAIADNERIAAALESAGREAALTHARLGRAIPEWRDGKVVEVTPAEIFARYGLDDYGRPRPQPQVDPNAPPDDRALLAYMEEYQKADQWYCEGKFNEYRGEYVFFSNGIIFGHGRNLVDLRPVAEEKAAALGIPPERVVNYFVPGLE